MSKHVPCQLETSVCDKYKRYVMLKGFIQGHAISVEYLAHPEDFFTHAFLEFLKLNSENVIVGGDFNCILNHDMDTFPNKMSPLSPLAKSLKAICKGFGLVDVWRFLHPLDKEFPFTPVSHKNRLFFHS